LIVCAESPKKLELAAGAEADQIGVTVQVADSEGLGFDLSQ
jgi:hypothetical protein